MRAWKRRIVRAVSGLPRRCEADAWEEEQRGLYCARRCPEGLTEGVTGLPKKSRSEFFGIDTGLPKKSRSEFFGIDTGLPKKSRSEFFGKRARKRFLGKAPVGL